MKNFEMHLVFFELLRFWKFPNIFPKQSRIHTFWEFLSKNPIWGGLYIKLAKLIDFDKKFKFFPKTPPVFPKNSKVWIFWECLGKNTIWYAFYRNIANISHFQKNKQFFEFTHLLSRKSQAVDCFEFYWAIIFWETFLKFIRVKCFWISSSVFSKKTSHFQKNPKFWTFSEHMSNSKLREAFEKNLRN